MMAMVLLLLFSLVNVAVPWYFLSGYCGRDFASSVCGGRKEQERAVRAPICVRDLTPTCRFVCAHHSPARPPGSPPAPQPGDATSFPEPHRGHTGRIRGLGSHTVCPGEERLPLYITVVGL